VNLVREKATGKRKTGATFIREYVRRHPKYKGDSRVGDEIIYDLCKMIVGVDSNDLIA
jgi:glutamate--cysteine ligase catalytic subunit